MPVDSEIEAVPSVILFDLGGVLADLSAPADAMRLEMTNAEFWKIWLSSANVKALETGQMPVGRFLPAIAAELGITDARDFDRRFRQWNLRLFDGAEALLGRLHPRINLALLSNTNEIHRQQITTKTKVFDRFSALFLSYLTNRYKPDASTFEFVIGELALNPAEILFLDDSLANVTAARSAGINAFQVQGFAQVHNVLEHFGF